MACVGPCCCGKGKKSQAGLDDIGALAGNKRRSKGRKKGRKRRRPSQRAPGHRPSVYFVKGSRVPVETLGSDTALDSRFFTLSDAQRREASQVHTPTVELNIAAPVTQEGGDSIRRVRRPDERSSLPIATDGEGEGARLRRVAGGLLTLIAATWDGRRSHVSSADMPSTSAAVNTHEAERMKKKLKADIRRCRSEC